MSAQLEYTHQSDTPLATDSSQSQDSGPAQPDGDRGMSLLFAFFGAMALMVGDVVLVSAVDRWWILMPAAAILLLMTFVVLVDIMRLLAED